MNVYKGDIVTYYVWSTRTNTVRVSNYNEAVEQALEYAKQGATTVWIDVDVRDPKGESGFHSGVSILRNDVLECIKPRYTKLAEQVQALNSYMTENEH